jgi:hypothetical protein
MKKQMKRFSNPSLVLAVAALMVALSGTAIAVGVGSNAIGSKALKKITVRTAKSPLFPAQGENNADPDRRQAQVACAKGEIALSGGLDWNVGDEIDLTALSTGEVAPILKKGEPVGYTVAGISDESVDAGPISFTAYAECLKK